MPTLGQISQINNASINDISSNPTPNFYKSSNNTIRCPEGKVFQGSHVLSTNGEDLSLLKYDGLTLGQSNWFKSNGSLEDGTLDESDRYTAEIQCVSKYCDPQGIVNSDKEFNVLVDVVCTGDTGCSDIIDKDVCENTDGCILTQSKTITCNDGYVFDTTNTKLGKVKCGAIPIMNDDEFNNENEVAWIVDNPTAEATCSLNNDERTCEDQLIPYIISSNTGEIYDNHERQLKCTWIPEIIPLDESGSTRSGFTRSNGKCKFIHRADFNESEPICRSMYCSKKSVPYSNRIESKDGPLPGPETGAIHGKCVDFDGQIIDNITNSSDCACFKHKSGDVCVDDDNCQWCGYNPDDGSGGYCYSTKTHLDICNINSIANNRGGVCNHTKKDTNKPDKPPGGWTKETCETPICVKKNYWNGLNVSSFETPEELEDNYEPELDSLDTCEGSNQKWYSGYISHNNNDCILENNKILNEYSSQEILIPYYPIQDNGDVKLNIEDYICVPINGTNTDASTCNSKNKNECVSDPNLPNSDQCEWIENPLRDSIFNWNRNDKLKFVGTGCPELFTTQKDEYLFIIEKQGKYIKLNNANLNDSPVPDYIDTCRITDVKYYSNIFDINYCSTDINGTSINAINDCHNPNIKYCPSYDPNDPDTTSSDPDPGRTCPQGESFTHTVNGEDVRVDGCKYLVEGDLEYESATHGCKDLLLSPEYEFKCSPEKTLAYNCNKHVGSNDESTCTNTNYEYYEDYDQLYSRESELWSYIGIGEPVNFKDYLLCNTKNIVVDVSRTNDELRCNMIGQDKAHWGKLCQLNSDDSIKIPVKHICELAEPPGGATWGNYINYDGVLEYGCYRDNGNKYDDAEVCGLLIKDSTNQNSLIDIQNASSEDSLNEDYQLTLIDSPDYDGRSSTCIIDFWGEAGDRDEEEYRDICESSVNHSIGFRYKQFEGDRTGMCVNSKTNQPIDNSISHDQCGISNNIFTNEYTYNDLGTFHSLGSSKLRNQPDVPTTWTGGEITFQDGIHRSECSPSIMNSCNVNCDAGYGGGGEYICQYNDYGGDICNDINRKTYPDPNPEYSHITKRGLCETYPACEYNEQNDQCIHNTSISNDGHLEWIGSPCYKIDNTDFSHGIAKLPELDKVIPPFVRVFMFMTVYITLAVLIISLIVKFGLKLIGSGLDLSINNVFNSVNKIIDVITDSDKVVRKIILSEGVKKEHKAGYMIFTVGVFIGSYYLFQYIKDYIKDSWSDITNYIRKLKPSSVRMPTRVSQAFAEVRADAEAARGAGRAPDINLPDLPDIDVTSDVKFDNLKIIIQTLVGGIVIFIIIALVAKSDLIGKVEQK